MLRIAIVGLCLAASVGMASAQGSTTPKKTGYLVRGCTYYVLQLSGKVVTVCDRRDARKPQQFWSLVDLESNTGSGGGNGN